MACIHRVPAACLLLTAVAAIASEERIVTVAPGTALGTPVAGPGLRLASGLVVNPDSGLLAVTPDGTVTVAGATAARARRRVTVATTGPAVDTTATILVATGGNLPPVVVNQPNPTAPRGYEWTFTPVVVDGDDVVHGFALATGPNGMTVDPATGALAWNPPLMTAATVAVALVVTDGGGSTGIPETTTFRFELEVAANDPLITVVNSVDTSLVPAEGERAVPFTVRWRLEDFNRPVGQWLRWGHDPDLASGYQELTGDAIRAGGDGSDFAADIVPDTLGALYVQVRVLDAGDRQDQLESFIYDLRVVDARPVAVLDVSPANGAAPHAVFADAGGSRDPDGSIAGYRWDWGDGSPAETTTRPSAVHEYTSAGEFAVNLTVVAADGVVSPPATAEVAVLGSHPPRTHDPLADLDGDGLVNAFDPDRDGDGVLDAVDAFPDQVLESVDSDTNGVGDRHDVFRFLVQATFGPSPADLALVPLLQPGDRDLDGRANTIHDAIAAWVDGHLNLPSAYDDPADDWPSHLQRTIEIAQSMQPDTDWFEPSRDDAGGAFNENHSSGRVLDFQMAAWWENALGGLAGRPRVGSDQLRQRVAYALSQFLVVSHTGGTLASRGEALAAYYDLLARHAFGNYRDLLGAITRSPAMGVYLSMQGNRKADPEAGTRPDENFAREVMQLFALGLYRLNIDGTFDHDGDPDTLGDPGDLPTPSYTQGDIEELAKVMTGWDLADNRSYGRLDNRGADYTVPMVFVAEEHEDEAAEGGDGLVTVLDTTFSLAAVDRDGQLSGLDAALDVLFAHPNVGPYVSRHLITRLVTSNPEPAYVARVARVFNDNGQGVRGDLKAVVRAILLDPRARGLAHRSEPGFGKVQEPILSFTRLLRATSVTTLDGWPGPEGNAITGVYQYRAPQDHFGQAPLRSPSVFNFYSPDYVPADRFYSRRGLTAPELQIQTDQQLLNYHNRVYDLLENFERNIIIRRWGSLAERASRINYWWSNVMLIDVGRELAWFETVLDGDTNGDFIGLDSDARDASGRTAKERAVDALLVHLDEFLLGGRMEAGFRAALRHYLLAAGPVNRSNPVEEAHNIVRDAFRSIAVSAPFLVQK